MSLFQRITRAFHTLSTIELDEQSRPSALITPSFLIPPNRDCFWRVIS